MFGNKHWGWKMAGALAILAALAFYAGHKGKSVNPPLWKCMARPDAWDGTDVWFQAVVEETSADEFRCRAMEVSVSLLGGSTPAVGDVIEVAGTFRKNGPHVEVRRMRSVPSYARLRWLLALVSLIVLAWVIVNFLKHFAFRPDVVRVERAD